MEQTTPHPPHIRSNPHLTTITKDQSRNNKMAVDLVIYIRSTATAPVGLTGFEPATP
jgi:hypothetical protein